HHINSFLLHTFFLICIHIRSPLPHSINFPLLAFPLCLPPFPPPPFIGKNIFNFFFSLFHSVLCEVLGGKDIDIMSIISLITGWPGPSGFGSASTAEDVTQGIDAACLTAIVTGGASGIGLETVRVLAMRKVHVIIGARNLEAANKAKQQLLEENPTAKLDVLKLDLSSIKSTTEFAHNFLALNLPLNILINNAGVMFCPFQLSEDGIEMQFATNHIGHFLLTNLLLEKMKNTAKSTGIEGRIVNLSSIAHAHTYGGGIRFNKINDKNGYSDKRAYGQSKLANILHVKELNRRFQEEGVNITANAAFTFFIWKSVPQGASTTCYVALHPNLKGVSGKYFLDNNEKRPSSYARDEKLAKKLWDFSKDLISSKSKV
uniref:Short-chain dehydrogenase TIC 32, chloroplastic n=1 Tax=Cucumis melo TaxID=3656 RepID=A0A9I9CVX6_CUCME